MSEELGKIEKPAVEDFREGRKLYFVPLIFSPREAQGDIMVRINRYWSQIESHLTNLEVKLGSVGKVYHELVSAGGEEGAKAIEELDKGSYQVIRARLERGAELHPVEDGELLVEFMDWSSCLALGLQSQQAFTKVYGFYAEAQKRRDSHIAQQIDETLGEKEAGILLMREGHHVQFPPDIQVFYVAPPALDELKRWLRERKPDTPDEGSEKTEEQQS